MSKDRKSRKLGAGKIVLIVILTIIFLVSGTLVGLHYYDEYRNKQDAESLKVLIPTLPSEDDSAPDYSELIGINSDFVGWINVPNTSIDYPVVQGSNNDYYLNHNFRKESDRRGAVYMDYRNDPVDLDANTIIYSHNFYDTTMFSELDQYDDIEFYKQTPVFYFNTVEKKYKCKIYAVFITNASKSEDNDYVFNYIYPYMDGENFDGFIAEVNKRRLYVTDVDINDNDHMVILSTCARNLDLKNRIGRTTYRANTRIVILARTLRAGESENVNVERAYLNPNPKYPQLYYDKHGIDNPYRNDEKWYPKEVLVND